MESHGEDELVRVHIAENRFEADHIVMALQEEGITVWIKEYADTAYNGLYVSSKGWGAVWVPKAQREHAERVIAETKEAFADA